MLKLMIPREGGYARNEITVLRLAGGLLATRIGLEPLGREMLTTADLVAG